MSTVEIDSSVRPPGHTARPRRRWLWSAAAVALVLIAGLIAVNVTRALDHRYGPIEQGAFAGQYSSHNFVPASDGFSYSLVRTPGVTGQLIASLSNLGSHSVRVDSIDTDDVASSVRWSTYRDGPSVFGAATPWHAFPAIVPAGGMIRLLITIHHPGDCSSQPSNSSGRYYSGLHTVHWQSLLRDHTTLIDDGLADRNIAVC